ncbi:MAG: hypothetical protein LBK73_00350 [Treponema sp.]|jgi:hypothetical protein|nr:hypothetical protein [Treponema sp.]
MKPTQKSTRTAIRVALVAVYIGLGGFLFVSFRGHTLLVDNHDTEFLTAPDMIMASVDKGERLAFFNGDRDRFAVRGRNVRIRIEFSDGKPTFEETISLPFKDDMYLLSIPKLLNNEPCLEPFNTASEPRAEEEEPIPAAEEFMLE